MSILFEERTSDSLYIETVAHGQTVCDGAPIRPAEINWHMVIVRQNDAVRLVMVGPWTTSGATSYTEGAEIVWIKFKLGVFMPHLPIREFLNTETILPGAASQSFWLKGSAWQFPDYENVETFVEKLTRDDVLVCDPVVDAVLEGHSQTMSPRTVRHHFLQATGLTHSHVRQVERAKEAAARLAQGVSILDVVHQLGYFDQPHLTRSLKRFTGKTPAQQLVPLSESGA